MQVIRESFAGGAQEIEDLWLPFFCVSTNLSKAQVQVHQLGPLCTLVRASMTIVGMVPPVIREGDMLVDGGYLNNLPVDVMHSLGVHTVVVVRPSACCGHASPWKPEQHAGRHDHSRNARCGRGSTDCAIFLFCTDGLCSFVSGEPAASTQCLVGLFVVSTCVTHLHTDTNPFLLCADV
jgi:predicted acylesterase/phospholipase RssA